MKEFRCVRSSLYPPKTEFELMTGQYIIAECRSEAIERMKKMYPNDKSFDAELFRNIKNYAEETNN